MILGILGAIITILILLNRLANAGIDLGGLNPFLWNRRRKWRKKYDGNPIFKIKDPMEVTALLMVGIAKADGDITKEDKKKILSLFETEFNLSKKNAVSLLVSSTYLNGTGDDLKGNVKGVMKPSLPEFSETQGASAIALLESVAKDTLSEDSQFILSEAKGVLKNALERPIDKKW